MQRDLCRAPRTVQSAQRDTTADPVGPRRLGTRSNWRGVLDLGALKYWRSETLWHPHFRRIGASRDEGVDLVWRKRRAYLGSGMRLRDALRWATRRDADTAVQ